MDKKCTHKKYYFYLFTFTPPSLFSFEAFSFFSIDLLLLNGNSPLSFPLRNTFLKVAVIQNSSEKGLFRLCHLQNSYEHNSKAAFGNTIIMLTTLHTHNSYNSNNSIENYNNNN